MPPLTLLASYYEDQYLGLIFTDPSPASLRRELANAVAEREDGPYPVLVVCAPVLTTHQGLLRAYRDAAVPLVTVAGLARLLPSLIPRQA